MITCEGRRGRGRPRRRWTQDIGEWMGVSTVEAGRIAIAISRQALERGRTLKACIFLLQSMAARLGPSQ